MNSSAFRPSAPGHRIRAKHDLESRRGHGLANEFMFYGKNLLHRGKAFLGVARRPEEFCFVLQIVFDHEAGLRIEVRTVLRHELQILRRCEGAVFDLRASRQRCRRNRFSISVHKRAQALFLGFIARRVELLLRERHAPALPDALRGEDFDKVRSRGGLLIHVFSNLIRSPGSFTPSLEGRHRRQNPRARQRSPRDGVPQRLVVRRAHTLHGCESGHERDPCI